jgi:hypothetical protein
MGVLDQAHPFLPSYLIKEFLLTYNPELIVQPPFIAQPLLITAGGALVHGVLALAPATLYARR